MSRGWCQWCGDIRGLDERFCEGCGHEAHVPRDQCACTRCRALGSLAAHRLREVPAPEVPAVPYRFTAANACHAAHFALDGFGRWFVITPDLRAPELAERYLEFSESRWPNPAVGVET